MKHLSLQWRITLLTALLIACACVCMNLLLYRTGVTGMDALNGFMMQYQPGSADSLTIEIPQEEMSSLLAHFSQEVYDAKVVFGRKGWCITAVVTILSAAIAYFVSGRALKPLQQLAQQAQQVDQDSIATTRLDENTVQEFGQLSRSVNRMLDGLAQSFELQRQFAGNAAHELRTPLAILQTKLELFAEEHPAMDAETAGLIRSLREQLDRLTALVRTLLEMSNLQSVSRTDQIALAPLVEEILTDLTPLAQKNNISLQQDCEELGMVGCLLLLLVLALIILRCYWVGRNASSPFSAYVSMGIAGMLLAQVFFNVGMCLYILPVMGLTLPFFSYGGSSIITLYTAMGIVSSIRARTLPSWLRDRNQL